MSSSMGRRSSDARSSRDIWSRVISLADGEAGDDDVTTLEVIQTVWMPSLNEAWPVRKPEATR